MLRKATDVEGARGLGDEARRTVPGLEVGRLGPGGEIRDGAAGVADVELRSSADVEDAEAEGDPADGGGDDAEGVKYVSYES